MLLCTNCHQRLKPGKAYLVKEEYYCNHCFDRIKAKVGKNKDYTVAAITNALEDVVADAMDEKND